jgi:hypothetical protein
VFNVFNHANRYVLNGDGIKRRGYNLIGANGGQTYDLAANLGSRDFGGLQKNIGEYRNCLSAFRFELIYHGRNRAYENSGYRRRN